MFGKRSNTKGKQKYGGNWANRLQRTAYEYDDEVIDNTYVANQNFPHENMLSLYQNNEGTVKIKNSEIKYISERSDRDLMCISYCIIFSVSKVRYTPLHSS